MPWRSIWGFGAGGGASYTRWSVPAPAVLISVHRKLVPLFQLNPTRRGYSCNIIYFDLLYGIDVPFTGSTPTRTLLAMAITQEATGCCFVPSAPLILDRPPADIRLTYVATGTRGSRREAGPATHEAERDRGWHYKMTDDRTSTRTFRLVCRSWKKNTCRNRNQASMHRFASFC